jgi:hypothetical protein
MGEAMSPANQTVREEREIPAVGAIWRTVGR